MKEIVINIRDRNFNRLGQVDQYKSYMPSKSWHGIGSVDFHLHDSNEHAQHLREDNILYTDSGKAYIINYSEIESTTGEMVVRGQELKSLLSRWLIFPRDGQAYFEMQAPAETIMKSYVAATLQRKGITEIIVAADLGRGEVTSFSARYDNLATALEKLSLDSGLGWDVRMDLDNKRFIFDVFVGLDRTAGQSENSRALFSIDYDNIKSQKLITSKASYANTAIVGGQGEGEWRVIEVVGEAEAGLDSREIFVDARDIEYDEYLADRGRQKLAEYPQVVNYDSIVDPQKNLEYEVDFALGDIVTVSNKKWGASADRRITEIKEVYEAKGLELEVSFGEPLRQVVDVLKKIADSPITEGGGGAGGGLSYPLGNVSDFDAKTGNEIITLKWADPPDRFILDDAGDPVPIATFAGTKILRKEESYPVDNNDGILVVDNKIRNQFAAEGFADSSLTNDTEYFYMAFPYTDKGIVTVDPANRISAVPADGDDKWTDIGSKFLVGGDMQAGYFGIVPASELITGDALAALVGISAGTSQFSTEGWLKFAYQGKILFVAKKTIRSAISWDQINAANCARGAVTEKTIKNHTFKIRLMKGSNVVGDDATSQYGTASSGALNHGSEWNKLMLPIHIEAKNKTWAYPNNVGANDTAYWGIDFTDADLQTNSSAGNGSYSWCQETVYDSSNRLFRGYGGVSYSFSGASSATGTSRGWRPCLELVVEN